MSNKPQPDDSARHDIHAVNCKQRGQILEGQQGEQRFRVIDGRTCPVCARPAPVKRVRRRAVRRG